ncbi:hypothetical protein COV19_04595 [Candidatus Woesearchaeota archaeon CG10_big_fil_rev_8_21_14_0_10_44_13]|nr:MAG: hypothetical protein COV19_04595 [Candidatus Woesearchaeota archaeon CG10_big_fil_rev_8_21_14_0_10_44_13]
MEENRVVQVLKEIGFTPLSWGEYLNSVKGELKKRNKSRDFSKMKPNALNRLVQGMAAARPEFFERHIRVNHPNLFIKNLKGVVDAIEDYKRENRPDDIWFLECGCGVALFLAALGKLYRNEDILFQGYESNGAFLRYSLDRVAREKLEEKVQINPSQLTHDKIKLHYSEGDFDIVVCHGSLELNDNKSLRSILSMVGEKGVFIFYGLEKMKEGPIRAKIEAEGFNCRYFSSTPFEKKPLEYVVAKFQRDS